MKRWAFAVVLLVSLPVLPVRADEAEDQTIEFIEDLGGVVTRDEEAAGEPVIEVILANTRATDADLKKITERLKHVRKLNLSATQVTGAGLAHLAPLKSLEELDLS